MEIKNDFTTTLNFVRPDKSFGDWVVEKCQLTSIVRQDPETAAYNDRDIAWLVQISYKPIWFGLMWWLHKSRATRTFIGIGTNWAEVNLDTGISRQVHSVNVIAKLCAIVTIGARPSKTKNIHAVAA